MEINIRVKISVHHDRVDESEIQEMAGFTQANSAMLEKCISDLIRISRKEGVPLGAVQSLISRCWKDAGSAQKGENPK